MIVELILDSFYGLVSVILTPVSFVLAPLGSMGGLIELLSYASIFVPVGTLGICLGIWIAFQGVRFTISFANWLIAKIPTID